MYHIHSGNLSMWPYRCTCLSQNGLHMWLHITLAYVVSVPGLIKETQKQFPFPSVTVRRAPGMRSRPARRVILHGRTDGYWRRRAWQPVTLNCTSLQPVTLNCTSLHLRFLFFPQEPASSLWGNHWSKAKEANLIWVIFIWRQMQWWERERDRGRERERGCEREREKGRARERRKCKQVMNARF